ncbi:hypothetical protein Pmani_037047 [Petrolisthes manimaculis]|uniref:Uncharacterized protein n=1 Tax=Petrolisthes manimaculis TaxID=1843537 RepID=A0AAE1TLJ2_9EUCA|nr:hypothetical protein Pmani_037047 [Petrolisthes manimaculis]
MSERDERGRLRLPRQDLVPFQRVLSRSNRSSRRPTPEKSGHISRSHSYNGQEVNRSLARLSLNNNNNNSGHKTRTHSHEHATTTKVPRIPFQRVLHRRRTHTHTLQPQVSTQEERYREIRNRRREEGGLFRPFATEYHSKYHMPGGQVKSRRKPSRYKNQSQLSSVIKDPTLPQSHGEEGDTGDRGDGGSSRSTGGSSNPSDTSSVKLPKIRDSPLTAPHSPDLHDPRPNTHAGRQFSGTRSMDTRQDTERRPHTEPRPISRAESRPGESSQHSHTDIFTVPSPDPIQPVPATPPQMST